MLVRCINASIDPCLEVGSIYEVMGETIKQFSIKNVGGIWPIGEWFDKDRFIILSNKSVKLYLSALSIQKIRVAFLDLDRESYTERAREISSWVKEDLIDLDKELVFAFEKESNGD